MHRPFGWKGGPGTCLWCGRKNPIYALDTTSESIFDGNLAKPKQEEPLNPPPGFRLQRMKGKGTSFRVYYFIKLEPRRGVHGDDHFCTRACAERFGVQCAKDGIRMEKK